MLAPAPLAAQPERFYLLRLTYNSMTVMVPFSHVEEIGLRKVTRNGEVARVLSFLAEGRLPWQRRLEGPLQREFRQDAQGQSARNR